MNVMLNNSHVTPVKMCICHDNLNMSRIFISHLFLLHQYGENELEF